MKQHRSSQPFSFSTLLSLALMQVMLQLAVAGDSADSLKDRTVSIFNSTQDGIKAAPAVTAVVAIILGLIVCFFGYRLFRPAMFLCGFLLGGILTTHVVEALFRNKSWIETAIWISFIIGGLIVGFLVIAIYQMGVFLIGAAAGVFLAYSINTSFGYKLLPSNPNLSLLILGLILGLLGGILTLKLEKPVVVVATALIGAELAVWGIGYFGKDYPNGAQLKQFRVQEGDGWIYKIPAAWWAYLAGIVVLFVLGMMMQFKKTARGHRHRSNSGYRQA